MSAPEVSSVTGGYCRRRIAFAGIVVIVKLVKVRFEMFSKIWQCIGGNRRNSLLWGVVTVGKL